MIQGEVNIGESWLVDLDVKVGELSSGDVDLWDLDVLQVVEDDWGGNVLGVVETICGDGTSETWVSGLGGGGKESKDCWSNEFHSVRKLN